MTSSVANGESTPVQEPEQRELAAVGLWLRRQREIREIDLSDIATETKISKRYLMAIEAGDFDQLPGPIFVRGFLRQYAAFTGLDPDEVFNNFLAAQQADDLAAEPESDRIRRRAGSRRQQPLALWGAVAVVLLAVVVAGGWWLVGRTTSQPPPAVPEAGPLPVAVPPPVATMPVETAAVDSAPDPMPLQVTLDFLAECWVEVVIDESRTLNEMRVQGESLQIEASEKVLLTVDNVEAVQVEVNGEPYALVADSDSEGARAVEIVAPEVESVGGVD